jgi:hypothetical protein
MGACRNDNPRRALLGCGGDIRSFGGSKWPEFPEQTPLILAEQTASNRCTHPE